MPVNRASPSPWPSLAAVLAVVLCVGAALAFAPWLDGYSHARHPLALLGAHGVPHATAFAALAYVLPGLLDAWVAVQARGRLPDTGGFGARLGVWMLAISALAFALQGLLPLDARDLDSAASRLHAAAWTLWWVAFVPGAALLAWGQARASMRSAPWFAGAALLVLLLLAALPQPLLPAAIAQRVALAAWLASYLVLSRGAASSAGSPPPAGR